MTSDRFYAKVLDAGGGEVRMVVHERTEDYPRVGQWVEVDASPFVGVPDGQATPPASTPLDLTDPAVHAMAEDNHQPDEAWSVAGTLLSVHCERCGHTWPCPTVEALRAEGGRASDFGGPR